MAKKNDSSKPSLAVQAYESIQNKIITMEFEPGQPLDEKQLVEQLGIGRTPIREALLRLASESLVDTLPNRGFLVRPLMVQDIKAMFEALRILEFGVASLAVRQDVSRYLPAMQDAHAAVKRAMESNDSLELVWTNYHFHMLFAQCAGNAYLMRALQTVHHEANRLAYLSYGGKNHVSDDLSAHYQSVSLEHENIMAYLKRKEPEMLKKTIEEHIQTFQKRIVGYLTTSLTS